MNQVQEAIKAILSKDKEPFFDQIMLCVEQIRKDGNTFFIGLDRIKSLDEARYIVEVSFPDNTKKNISQLPLVYSKKLV